MLTIVSISFILQGVMFVPSKHVTLIQSWASVEDVGPTLTQHQVNVPATTILVNLKVFVKTVLL